MSSRRSYCSYLLALFFHNSYEPIIGPCDLIRKCILPTQAQHIQGSERQQMWLQGGFPLQSVSSGAVASPQALSSCLIWPLLVRIWGVRPGAREGQY